MPTETATENNKTIYTYSCGKNEETTDEIFVSQAQPGSSLFLLNEGLLTWFMGLQSCF